MKDGDISIALKVSKESAKVQNKRVRECNNTKNLGEMGFLVQLPVFMKD
jgi:hypothetical protein